MTSMLPVHARLLLSASFAMCPVCAEAPRARADVVCGGCRVQGGLGAWGGLA